MLFQEDWIMRQIAGVARLLAKLLFNKDSPAYVLKSEAHSAAADGLHSRLLAMLASGDINGAENLLFESAVNRDMSILEVALDFYNRLNGMTNEALAERSFTRAEIQSGLNDLLKVYDIDPWMYNVK